MLALTFALLIALLALAIPVAAALGLLGLALDRICRTLPLSLALGRVAWSASQGLPAGHDSMFILLGEILLRAGVAERMYEPW
ncbi:MAG: hypothetical protein M5U08_14020 [Burkholderiales bacterium]|nr:hypothetical protein [Burkholderiales bacterium]